ncbi:MAG: right-handed parallel beta-helix repeat-containing protein [Sedimentisphaerales bacterium]|nr:right-handed parallel beta-helix repeat-containing protein [Sedimentisphaerales bacterium]
MTKRANITILVLSFFIMMMCGSNIAAGKIIYVDDNAAGLNDGSSWENAYVYLQDALFDANDSEKPVEVYVAQGTYIPYPYEDQNNVREASFQLINDVNIIGGFAGISTTNPDERDFELFETILSGDLNGDDVDVNDPCDLFGELSRAENCYHVVTGNGNNETAILDGFIITGGNANGRPINKYNYGGGMFNDGGSPLLINCTFSKNYAAKNGGGIYNDNGDLNISNCKFIKNYASDSGGGFSNYQGDIILTNSIFTENSVGSNTGGGFVNYESNSIVTECTFTGNTARSGGGITTAYSSLILKNCTFTENSNNGLYNLSSDSIISNCNFTKNLDSGIHICSNSNPVISNCIFADNISYQGGGIYNDDSNSILNNCLFTGNSADRGGGCMCTFNSNIILTNCTITGNTAEFGDGIICANINFSENNLIELINCIVWQSENGIWIEDESTVNISYSNIYGGWPGEGNIDEDPLFLDPLGPDLIGVTEDDDLRLSPLSPCVDSGDPDYVTGPNETDLDGNPRVESGRIDMGAYEFQNVIYVDDDADGLNDGSSWENAFCYLQDALNSVDTGYQIHVAQGTYTPDLGFSPDEVTSEEYDIRESTFILMNDISLHGGYAGLFTENPNARDINLYETILSGDLYGNDVNDVDVNDYNDLWELTSRAENIYHVVTGKKGVEGAITVLDGFTITGGNANGSSNSGDGAGIFNSFNTMRIQNCKFNSNSAKFSGGGIYSYYGNLTLTDCTFANNVVGTTGGGGLYTYRCILTLNNCLFIENLTPTGSGGGIYNNDSNINTESNPILNNCIFIKNSALWGGGICNENSSPISTNCKFIENIANYGGGIYNSINRPNNPILTNCLFIGNFADKGGGIYNFYRGEPILVNCTFTSNSAQEGNALYCKSSPEQHSIRLYNCILWDGGNEIYKSELSDISILFSNIQGGWPGQGNIDEDPLFLDPLGPDLIGGTEDDDLRLSPLSPCVDSGQLSYEDIFTETDLDGNLRTFGDNIDMGVYEFQGTLYVDNDARYDNVSDSNIIEDGTRSKPFNTIQEAIDIAKDEYKVLVLPGVYDKINFLGKSITVSGTEGAAIIQADPGNLGNSLKQDAVTFYSGEDSNSVLKNFIIKNSGLAISLNYGSSPTIQNITVVENLFGIAAYEDSNPDIRNCIFYNNTDGDLFGCDTWYSCIEGGTLGMGNFYDNPLFVDEANGDYHLKSKGWRWNEQSESWTWDEVTSPCIDSGDPHTPLGDEPMSILRDPDNLYGINKRINTGAYGGTPQASMPPLGWIPINYDDIITSPSPSPAQWNVEGLYEREL